MISDAMLKKIRCKSLINAVMEELNITHIPVVFDTLTVVNKGLLAFLSVIDDEAERKKYELLSDEEKKTYQTQSAKIYFPDLSVWDFIDMLKCDGSGLYDKTLDIARKIDMKTACNLNIRCVLFTFLHEVGHWFQLIRLGVYEYINMDKELSEKNAKAILAICNGIRRSPKNAGKKKISMDADDKKRLRQLQDEYREIPKEKEADKFAADKMWEIDIDKILAELKRK